MVFSETPLPFNKTVPPSLPPASHPESGMPRLNQSLVKRRDFL